MKDIRDIPAPVIDEVRERENAGKDRMLRPVDCLHCGKSLARQARYRVHVVQTAAMPAPGFYYYCVGCIKLPGKDGL